MISNTSCLSFPDVKPQIYLPVFLSFLFSSFLYFSTFPFSSSSYILDFTYYTKSTFSTCKHQICKLRLHCKHIRSGTAGLYGGSAALIAFYADTSVRIGNVTVLSYLVFTLNKLRGRPLPGQRYTSLSPTLCSPHQRTNYSYCLYDTDIFSYLFVILSWLN